ncbi:unnamed protein product [Alopecurus aequalis]
MADRGVYEANWALFKVLEESDVKPAHNRLLLAKDMVRGGPIPSLFPELEVLDEDGLNAQITVSVTLLAPEGRERKVVLGYLNSNMAYRIRGAEWKLFVKDNGICNGDRLDLYACKRGDGERFLFSFTSKGGDASAWCINGRKRARQPVAAAALAARDHKRQAKSSRAKREGRGVMDDACTGGFQADYGCCKAAGKTMEDQAPPRSWKAYATTKEKEAAKGLLMLKYAILAEYYY